MTMPDLNAFNRDTFVARIGWVFEHSPWVAEAAWEQRPFSDLPALHNAMSAVVRDAPPDRQLALLRAHPDLGTRARISGASAGEQAGAGLHELTPEEFERLHSLNAAYKNKFGFPFLYAVKGSTKHDILNALAQRLPHAAGEEFAEALQQVCRIALFRLRDTIQS
jgi:2-oxo-4-hydroxy-4-carboxy-5-ureidoimidazoline decarboxylase